MKIDARRIGRLIYQKTQNQIEDELKGSKLRVAELEEALKNLEEEKRKIKLHLDEFISENANFKEQV